MVERGVGKYQGLPDLLVRGYQYMYILIPNKTGIWAVWECPGLEVVRRDGGVLYVLPYNGHEGPFVLEIPTKVFVCKERTQPCGQLKLFQLIHYQVGRQGE